MSVSEEANQLWNQVLGGLTGRVGEQMIQKLLRPLEAVDAGGGVLLLRAPNDFTREWVTKAYLPVIEDALQKISGEAWHLHWAASAPQGSSAQPASQRPAAPSAPLTRQRPVLKATLPSPSSPTTASAKPAAVQKPATVGTSAATPASTPPPPRTAPAPAAAARTAVVPAQSFPGAATGAVGCGLAAKYTFDQFVIGPSNEVAHAMAAAMANRSGRRVNVLFICGGTGLGKTHLSNAIGHRIIEQDPNARIVYVSAETFTNQYVAAIQQKKMDEFRARYRNDCDALLIDDVQFLAGKEGTQDEFFHTFNSLYQRDLPIVLTSDVLPQKLQGMAERLMSRFASGLVAEIYTPEVETRVAILRQKAVQEKVRIDDDAAFLMASAVASNVRELEGTLMKLAIKASISGRTLIDAAMVRETLKIASRTSITTVEDVQRAVCDHYRIKMAQLIGKERHREVALPRQVAMYLARVHLGTSFPQIGAKFNGKDHTTVISSVRKIEKLAGEDTEVRQAIETLSLKLGFNAPGLGTTTVSDEQ